MKKNKSAFSLIEISIVILVVGILIAGVTSGLKLVSDSKLKTARSLSQSSIVNGLDGLVLWIDATAENVYTNSSNLSKISDGERVKTIRDINSGSVNTIFSEATSNGGPTYVKSGINRLPSLYFDGSASGSSGSCLRTTYRTALDPLNFTFFIVTTPLTRGEDGVISLYSNVTTGYTGKFRFFKNSYGTTAYYMVNISAFIPTSNSSVNLAVTGVPTIVSALHSEPPASSTPIGVMYQKGVATAIDTTGYHYINDEFSTSDYIYIGCRISSGSLEQFYNGYISEIILLDRAVTSEERLEIEKYLMKKYSIR